jgi:hypothetical protein
MIFKSIILIISVGLIGFSSSIAQSLIIPAKGIHIIKDSTVKELILDSLVLNKKSSLIIKNSKDFVIKAKHIVLEDKTSISAHDGKNNGTNLKINGKFVKIGKSVIDVSGLNYVFGDEKYSNGNGGNVEIKYDPNGLKPQSEKTKEKNYVEVLYNGASSSVNPQTEIQNIWYRIGESSRSGRALSGLPRGKIFDAGVGKNGSLNIQVEL